MRVASIFALALAAGTLVLPVACSDTVVKSAPSPAVVEAGPPSTPEDVPAVKLEADPQVDCPPSYRATALSAGLNEKYSVAGQERELELILPEDTTTPRPMLVAFNGTGEDGPSFAKRAKLADFAARGFIVVAPSSAGNGVAWPVWDALREPGTEDAPNKDLEYFDSLVKCTAAHQPVDKNRIYVAGHSAGGIMVNHVLQRRSQLLAGGIPASGVFSLTAPAAPAKLDPLFVIVTWGGDNDRYTGSAGGVSVGAFNFVSEASLASKFYDSQESVAEVNCRGNNVGHAWLSSLNDWFVDQLLAHPKGLPGRGSAELVPALPAGAPAACNDAPYEAPSTAEVVCGTAAKDGCQQVCQLFGDCAVENGTVGPALSEELTAIGFSGPKNENCGGCLAKCQAEATTASDAAALACFKTKQAAATCEQGINGALPLIKAVNECCGGRTDSLYCVAVCKEIMKNSSAATFFSSCQALAK